MKRKTRSQRPTEEGWAQEENQITVSEENSRDQVQDSVPDTITQSKTTLALSATFQAPASTPIISVAPSLLNSSALVNSIPTQSNSTFGIRFNALHQLLGDLSNPNHLHSSQLLGSHELADTGKSVFDENAQKQPEIEASLKKNKFLIGMGYNGISEQTSSFISSTSATTRVILFES